MKTKLMIFVAALIAGLLLYCPECHACDEDFMPRAGFFEFINGIEVEPIYEETHLPAYYITPEDADLIMRVGIHEAAIDGVEGIGHAMQVVMNRFESELFPMSIQEVIFQEGQFSTASKLAYANITEEQWAMAREALELLKQGEFQHNKALYFESLPGLAFAGWAEYQFSFGGHDFYI